VREPLRRFVVRGGFSARPLDGLKDLPQGGLDIEIRKSDNAALPADQVSSALHLMGTLGRVPIAIDLDHQARLRAIEIDHIPAERMLTPELESTEPAVP